MREGLASYLVAPLLECDFELLFRIGETDYTYDSQYSSVRDFVLTSLSGLPTSLSWSPHNGVLGVPMPSVGDSYMEVGFMVSSVSRRSNSPFFRLYDAQFTEDGVLRQPMAISQLEGFRWQQARELRSFSGQTTMESTSTSSSAAYSTSTGITGYVRPDCILRVIFPHGSVLSRSVGSSSLEVCRFKGCVFGTPTPSMNPGSAGAMLWRVQVGYRYIEWLKNTLLTQKVDSTTINNGGAL